jgi:hypothetical protein
VVTTFHTSEALDPARKEIKKPIATKLIYKLRGVA